MLNASQKILLTVFTQLMRASTMGSDAGETESKDGVAPVVEATSTSNAPVVDGALSDPVWQKAAVAGPLIQRYPDAGKAAAFTTEVKFLYDADAFYVSAKCVDPEPEKIVSRVTRRDRWVESDWFQLEIDSRHDHRTGYFFAVNAAGVKLDGVLFDENQEISDWDGVWEAAAVVTPEGWNVEMRIPLRLLRFDPGANVLFGVSVGRWVSRLHEADQWPYVAPETGLRVSKFADFRGMDIPRRATAIDIVPYAAGRIGMGKTPLGPSSYRPFDAGADVKVGLGGAFALTMTANPDFGQTEVDQAVLNLSTVETYFPEKRPFFLEDMAVFQTPGAGDSSSPQLFYSRRIGRAPRSPNLGDGETLSAPAGVPRIYGAAKMAGRTAGGLSAGLLQAVTSSETATVRRPDGSEARREAEPLTSFSVARVKQELGARSSAGIMSTAAVSPEHGGAFTGGADLAIDLPDGSWGLTAQSYLSYLTEKRSEKQDGFTRVALDRDGPVGYGGELNVAKKSGEHIVGGAGASYRSPSLALNDLGYLDRADQIQTFAWIQYRTLRPVGPVTRAYSTLSGYIAWNTGGTNIGQGLTLSETVVFRNNWAAGARAGVRPGVCDDREPRSPERVSLCSETARWLGGIWLNTDSGKPFSLAVELDAATTERGTSVSASTPVRINPHARVQLDLVPRYQRADGVVRGLGTDGEGGALQYRFVEEHNESVDVTVRGTFTLSTALSFQVYAQALLGAVDYTTDFAPFDPAGDRIAVGQLTASESLPGPSGYTVGVFNTSSVVRWEYEPGSVAYLVYTTTQGLSSDAPEFRFGGVFGESLKAAALHMIMVKLSYLWSV
jgi:hypothetical protein